MIKADHISKSFDGRVVLDDVSVEFDTGTTNLVIGKSGSGKTVLLKCLVGLHEVDSGSIWYDDIDFTALGFKLLPTLLFPVYCQFQLFPPDSF